MIQFLLHTIVTIGLMLPFALGYSLVFGKGKILHFGPIGVSLVAAYGIFATPSLIEDIPEGLAYLGIFVDLSWTDIMLISLAMGIFLTILLSSFFAWLALRLEPDSLGIMTIAVHLAVLAIVLNTPSITRGALGITHILSLPMIQSLPAFALFAGTSAVLWFMFYLFIDRSPFARQLSALAEHEWHAAALGINRTRVVFLAFLIIGLTQVWTNFLFPQYIHILHPNDYQFSALIFVTMIVIAGKPGSVWGVTLSTILLICLKESLRFVPLSSAILGPVRLILFGVILFAVVWWRRDSIFPQRRQI